MPRDRLPPSPAAATPILHSRAAKDRSNLKTSGFHRATTRTTPGHALISAFPPPCLFHLIPPIKPALHRSPAFLIGLFPIVLLLWAWADSVKHGTRWSRSIASNRVIWVHLANSKFIFGHTRGIPDGFNGYLHQTGPYGSASRLSARAFNPSGTSTPIFPALLRDDGDPTIRLSNYVLTRLHVPLWLILAAYLPLWLGLSYWRSRSKLKRLAAALPNPAQPQSELEPRT